MTANRSPSLMLALVLAVVLGPLPARAAEAPYDASLLRMAEILGSLHYLRNLCGENGTIWRDKMNELLTVEAPETERRRQLTASFNRGYRGFAAVHVRCTETSREAIAAYLKEGEKLSEQIVGRFGN
jgi:uncharacterized protein (TIGR02301 family)